MAHLNRKIENKLMEWYNSNYGLLVYGARQVGKTYIIKKFIENHFPNFYYINLYNNVDAIETLLRAKDSVDFILRLSIFQNTTIKDGDCIFIDELQELYTYLDQHKNEFKNYFDPMTGIKFIVESKKYRIIYSGSLLRFELNHIISNPVGYVLPIEMYPLDFEEFLWANNVNPQLIKIAEECFINKKEVPDYIHKHFMNLFTIYLLVGGMPDAVSAFIDHNSFAMVENAHKTIDFFIKQDLIKYTSDNEKLKIQDIYDLVPTELNNPNKKFILSHIPNHNKNDNEILSFSWLNKAGVTIPVYIAGEPIIPLKISANRNCFKLFYQDVGLFTYSLLSAQSKASILNGNINMNFGSIFECVAAQLLYCHGFNDLYYYNNKKYGEVDFLIQINSRVLPIEIKSGKDYKRHRALNNILNVPSYHLEEGYVFYSDNVEHDNNVFYFPIYLIEFLRK